MNRKKKKKKVNVNSRPDIFQQTLVQVLKN